MSHKWIPAIAGITISFLPALSQAVTNLPADVTIITRNDIVGRNFTSVGDALEQLTSIRLRRDGSPGTQTLVQMRGSSPKQTAVYLDGRPLSSEFDSQVDLTQIPINIVERLEITKGAAPANLSAEGVAGSINIITSRPQEKGFDTELGAGVARNGEKDAHGRFFGRGYLGDATYLPSTQKSGGFSANEDYWTVAHFGNVSRSFNGKGYWGAEYYYQEANIGLSKGTPIPFEQWNGHLEQQASDPDAQRTQTSQHAKINLGSPEMWGGMFHGSVTQAYRQSDDRAGKDGLSLLSRDSRSTTYDLKWQSAALEVGGQARDLKRSIYPSPAHYISQNSGYVMATKSAGAWTARPSLRFDHHSKSGDFVSPRLVAMYNPVAPLIISGDVTRNFRAPTFDELFPQSGIDNQLGFEKSWSYNAGAAWNKGPLAIKANGFTTTITDLIHSEATSSRLINEGEEKNHGIESEFAYTTKNNTLKASHTWQKSKRSLNGQDFVASALSPEQTFLVTLKTKIRFNMDLTNEWRYKSEQYELDNHQGVRIPPYYVWSIRLGMKILEANLYLDVQNVTGRRYADALGTYTPTGGSAQTVLSPQPDRSYSTGFSIKFKN